MNFFLNKDIKLSNFVGQRQGFMSSSALPAADLEPNGIWIF